MHPIRKEMEKAAPLHRLLVQFRENDELIENKI